MASAGIIVAGQNGAGDNVDVEGVRHRIAVPVRPRRREGGVDVEAFDAGLYPFGGHDPVARTGDQVRLEEQGGEIAFDKTGPGKDAVCVLGHHDEIGF